MIITDYTKESPCYNNGTTKWFINKHFQNYLENNQAENLPKLENLGCFVVQGNPGSDIDDLVLIDDNQNVISSYSNSIEGYGQMTAKINILKIIKNYGNDEI